MRKRLLLLALIALLTLAIAAPASADQGWYLAQDDTAQTDDGEDDGTDYGWIGLLGLAGLAGLLGRKRDDRDRTVVRREGDDVGRR